VVDDYTQCETQPQTATILDKTKSNVSITFTGFPSLCSSNNGAFNVKASRADAVATTFTFDVHRGGPTNATTPVNFYSNPPTFDPVLDASPFPFTLGPVASGTNINSSTAGVGLPSDNFSVVATDGFGCKTLVTKFLPFANAHSIDSLHVNSTICPYTVGNGSITANVIPASPPPPAAALYPSYSLTIFSGANPGGTVVVPSTVLSGAGTPVVKNGLAPGFYTIQIQESYTGSNCKVYQVMEIKRDALAPVVDVQTVNANTACDLTVANGSAKIDIQKDAADKTVGSTYQVDVSPAPLVGSYPNPAAFPPGLAAGVQTISGLNPDNIVPTYTVTVTSSNNCITQRLISVPNKPTTAQLVSNDITITDAGYCVAARAQENVATALVTKVRLVDGVTIENKADYQFDWYTNPALTLASKVFSAPGNAAAISGGDDFINQFPTLASGTVPPGTVWVGSYYLQLTKTADASGSGGIGCISAPYKVDINDATVKPTVTFATTDNTACDPTTPDGKITVTAVDASGPGVGKTYDFVWTAVPALSSAANALNTSSPHPTGGGDKISDGTFAIDVTNFETKCKTSTSVTVEPSPQPVSIATATHLDQTLCKADGQITVTGVSPNAVADYTYLWYRTSTSTPPLQDITPANIVASSLTTANYPTIGADTYFVTGTKLNNGTGGAGCTTAPFPVVIKDISVNPTLALAAFTNTACDANYEGKITVTLSETGPGSGQTYAYTWDPGNPQVITPPGLNTNDGDGSSADGDGDAPTNLIEGIYKIKVTNNFTNCIVNGQTHILQSGTPIVVTKATPTDQQKCSALPFDGSAVVGANDVLVNNAPDVHTNFIFEWRKGTATGTIVIPGAIAADNLNVGTYPAISAGDYFVTAQRKPGIPVGSGCISAPAQVTIRDITINPTVTLTPFTNTSCDNVTPEGQIQVDATDAAGTPGGAPGHFYNYTWAGTNPTAIGLVSGSGVANLTTANLLDGTYDVQVSNNLTGCIASAQTKVLQSNTPVLAVIASKTDQALCSPDGSVTVGNVIVTDANNISTTVTHPNILFNWYLSDPTTPSILSGVNKDVLDKNTIAVGSMGKGTYYVTATRKVGAPGSGCTSAPVRVDVKDIHVDPTIAAATVNVNVNCIGAPIGTGQIQINETTPTNFTYNWFAGDDITDPPVAVVAPGNIAQNLLEGDYTVQVKDNATSCVSVERYTISNYPTILSFSPSGFSAPAVNTCVLATGAPSNGSATITLVDENKNGSVNSVPVPDPNYTFTWFNATSTQLQTGLNPVLSNIPPGSYLVTATNTASHCTTDFSFDILDKTLGSTVTLIDFAQPERCVIPKPKTGFLTAQGGGTVPGLPGPYTFSYEWYVGDQRPSPPSGSNITNPSPPGLIISGPNGETLSNIPNNVANQIYTVKTVNNKSSCWVVDAYEIPVIVNPIAITASANPLTYCTSDNGEAFSTIANDNKFRYNFMWGKGNAVNPPIDFTTSDVFGLPAGNYTVVAVDTLDAGCVSPMVTVTIDNMQTFPIVSTKVRQPLTMCDPARPDGVASADVGGDVVHYTFDWYVGKSATGTSFYTGAEVGNLTSTDYTVVATDNVTACSTPATISVPTNFAVIPAPTVTTVSNVTSCVTSNGQLSATVDGVTKDYTFDWRNGSKAPPPIDFTGDIYTGLSAGDYTVIATSLITGCVSSPTTTPIIIDQKFPVFEFLIQNATCTVADGFVSVLVTNDVVIDNISWDQEGTPIPNGDSPSLENAMAGTYHVILTTNLGCQADGNVNLPANINPFNGISKLADGKNDFFLIDCIEQFPQNHVEIFNRAGTKVYEADGYDNMDVLFDGKSNRGISIMGTNLPAGTYYYVISKGDGTKRVVGYLELVD
jgi:hypothetical protein